MGEVGRQAAEQVAPADVAAEAAYLRQPGQALFDRVI